MSEPESDPAVTMDPGVPPELEAFLAGTGDMPVAPLFAMLARQVALLGVETIVHPFAVQFHQAGVTLCELSVYGELFIVRVGPSLAVEYRVRNEEVAFLALDHVLRTYVARRPPIPQASTQSAAPGG